MKRSPARRVASAQLALAIACLAEAASAQSQVAEIKVNGASKQNARIYVTAPRSSRALRQVALRQNFGAGTVLQTPAGVQLSLQSSNGNVETMAPGAKLRIDTVSANGESYSVLDGGVSFWIRKKLGFFKAGDGRKVVQGSARATRFSVSVQGDQIRFQEHEGQVTVKRKFQVRVAGAADPGRRNPGRKLTTTRSEELSASGQSYDLGYYDEQFVEFGSYDEAENYFRRHSAQQQQNDPEQAAEDATTLGHLLLDEGEIAQATQAFQKALQLDTRLYGEIDPVVADDHANLGYAYLEAGQAATAIQHLGRALQIYDALYPGASDPAVAEATADLGMAYALAGDPRAANTLQRADGLFRQQITADEAYYQAIASEDPTDAWFTLLDLSDGYEGLGFVASLRNDTATEQTAYQRSDYYEAQANALEDSLGQHDEEALDQLGY